MPSPRLPHPLPYQGSKRKLASTIGYFVKRNACTWYEPFAGSIAMTIWAASQGIADRYVIGDSLITISNLWEMIITSPETVSSRYREIWNGQTHSNPDYFNVIRSRYNSNKDPVDLLYLICRCVKNSVRFNRQGAFTQSVDKRRLGMHPKKMETAVHGVSFLLRGRIHIRKGDWMETLSDSSCRDYVYLDPPYLGTSIGRDRRYAHQMKNETLISGLEWLIRRRIPFSLSYDGMTGKKEYGPPLPKNLEMTRLLLPAGTSSQATLVGRSEQTWESLYLWPSIGPPELLISSNSHSESLAGAVQASFRF